MGIFLSLLVTGGLVYGLWTSFNSGSSCRATSGTGIPAGGVGLFDSLASEYPDPFFVEKISSSAVSSGYSIDYYPPERSNMDSIVQLPEKGYAIVILRTHGGSQPVIATSDPYDANQRVSDQFHDRLGAVELNGHRYFALTPSFITSSMCGQFPDTIVIAMGCNTVGELAYAFIEKGARAFIGWSGYVTVYWTDQVVPMLVELLLEGIAVGSAVEEVTNILGPDLQSGAHLTFVGQ